MSCNTSSTTGPTFAVIVVPTTQRQFISFQSLVLGSYLWDRVIPSANAQLSEAQVMTVEPVEPVESGECDLNRSPRRKEVLDGANISSMV